MAISLNPGRQEVLAAYIPITYATVADDAAVSEAVAQVPEGAIVVGGAVSVTEVFDSTTSDVLDLGDGGVADRYTATPVNLQALGGSPLDITGYQYTAQDNIDLQWTAGSTGTATQGAAMITILYIVDGRACVSEG